MISVIIPLYNKEKQIAFTLLSVLQQTFKSFEVVIVDDGSTDNSVQEVEQIKDARIRLIRQQNAGVSAARNRGIAEARYDLVAFLDADDEWKPTYLETQYRLYQKYPGCSVYACGYEFQDTEGRVTSPIIHKLPFDTEDGVLTNYFEVACCSHPPICSISIMVKKKAMRSIGGFPLHVTLGEDILTWAKLVCRYKTAYSRKIEAIYNFRSQKQLVTPRRPPDKKDIVGQEFAQLFQVYRNVQPSMNEYVALWHKMRMVTFVRLGMRREANDEYSKIKRYIKPNKKYLFWHYLNYLPKWAIRFILLQLAKIR